MNNKPVRLDKVEPLEIKYNKATVYSTGALFIIILFLIAFSIGIENSTFLLWSCI